MRGLRRQGVAGAVFVAALVLSSTAIPAAAAPSHTPAPDVKALAGRRGTSVRELQRIVAADRTLSIGPRGEVRATDPVRRAAGNAAAPAPAPITAQATDDVFALHSRPGSDRVIYLDFDGHTIPSNNAWTEYIGAACQIRPFSLDSNTSNFSTAERARIRQVWEIVAEDFAPFDVDVTTADPGQAAITRSSFSDKKYGTRALIAPPASTCNNGVPIWETCDSACSGAAYIGVFDDWTLHSYYQPAMIFAGPNVGSTGKGFNNSARSIAETVSHEVGHTVGLFHDGSSEQCAGEGCGYYEGHGAWAPIMGFSDYRPIAHWSQGEYRYANNFEDDFEIMSIYGLELLGDDHGNWIDNPTKVSSPVAQSGLITDRGDIDVFAIDAAAGLANFTASPAANSPNLDIRLELRDASFALLATGDPPSGFLSENVATGLNAIISRHLTAGRYYLVVDGVGFGKPATTGYSDYGSIGRYTVTGTFTNSAVTDEPSLPSSTPPAAPTDLVATQVRDSVELSWQAPVNQGTKGITHYVVRITDVGTGTMATLTTTARTMRFTSLSFKPYQFTVQAVGQGSGAQSAPVSITLSSAKPVTSVSKPAGRWTLNKSIPVQWNATDAGWGISDYDVAQRGSAWNSGSFSEYKVWKSLTTSTAANYSGSYGATYCFRARATNKAEYTTYSPGENCTAVPFASGHLAYSKNWVKQTNSGSYVGTFRKTTVKGSSVSKSGVRAKRFVLVATKCAKCGKVKVYWNGSYRTIIDLHAKTTQRRQVIPLFTFSTVSKPGTIKLMSASNGKPVIIEGLGVSKF